MQHVARLALALSLTLFVGCASMGPILPTKGNTKAAEIDRLRQELNEMRRRATMAEVEAEHLRKQLAELQKTSDRAAAGELEVDPEPVIRRPAAQQMPVPQAGDALEIEVVELEPAPQLEAAPAVELAATGASEPPRTKAPATAAPGRVRVSEEGQALYDRGYTLFHRGKYLDAETVFQQFLASFGDTDLGDNAQFWIGESRYARKDLSGAMAAFREVAHRFPEGNKVADALLKVADCQGGLGDIAGARRTYQDVVERFPNAAAAAVAEDRLRDDQ